MSLSVPFCYELRVAAGQRCRLADSVHWPAARGVIQRAGDGTADVTLPEADYRLRILAGSLVGGLIGRRCVITAA